MPICPLLSRSGRVCSEGRFAREVCSFLDSFQGRQLTHELIQVPGGISKAIEQKTPGGWRLKLCVASIGQEGSAWIHAIIYY